VGFTHSLGNYGYEIVHSQLVQDEQGVWRMDFADMEKKIVENKIHTAIFCSPHNPTGRVWERWELETAMELFRKYDVYVISDEIWSDLLLFGNIHIPTQSISPDARMRTIALYSPSKTFNLAGLVGSYSITYNDRLRHQLRREAGRTCYNNMNVLSMHALIGAYSEEGRRWLTELQQVLSENAAFACDYIRDHFEGVAVTRPQGTYMLFPDCAEWCKKHGKTLDEVEQASWDAGVALQDGRMFHGKSHLRINLALPLSRVREAMERLDKYVFNGL
jgi:cystathionine beta-lyase